jgi:hypothetical protein
MAVLHLVTDSGSVFFVVGEARRGLWICDLARKVHLLWLNYVSKQYSNVIPWLFSRSTTIIIREQEIMSESLTGGVLQSKVAAQV